MSVHCKVSCTTRYSAWTQYITKIHPRFVVERIEHIMEEQQIRDFVHRVTTEETLRTELANNPQSVIDRESFSPRVAQVVMQLVPHLALNKPTDISFRFWQ